MSNEWIFSLSITFLSQTILKIFKSSWSFALFFISFLMIISWLLVSIMMHISCVSTAKIWHTIRVEFMISFAHVWVFFKFVQVFELTAWRMMSSLSSLQNNMIRFHCAVNTFVIFWRICSIVFFCIFFISFLFIIFIITFYSLQSDDKSSLNCCSFVVVSSFATSAYDVIFNVKRVFSYVCNCLLSSRSIWYIKSIDKL